MCWLLIRAFSDTRPSAWKLGDIVEVRPDSFTDWGALETLPRFYRVQVTGVSATAVKARLEKADATINSETGEIINHIRVRLYGIRLADIPAGARNTLQNTGQLIVSKAQALNYIRDNYGTAVQSLD
jgi:hypothetical protein